MRNYFTALLLGGTAMILLLAGCGDAHEPDELVTLAGKQLSSGKYAQALSTADRAVAAAPGRFDAVLLRAMAQERLGRPDLALQNTLEAERLAPTSFAVQYMLGRLYSAKPETRQEALIALSKALALRPGDRNALIMQCNLYTGSKPKTAMNMLNTLGRDVQLASDPVFRNELGISQILSGDVAAGGNNLNLAVEKAKRNAVFQLNYARYLDFYAHQPEKALAFYKEYLALSGSLPGHGVYQKWAEARCAAIQQQRR